MASPIFRVRDLPPKYWVSFLKICLVYFVLGSAHVAGYVMMFPGSLISMLNLKNLGSQLFDVGISTSFAVLAFHLAETLYLVLSGLRAFLFAKFVLRPKVSINSPLKLRWMRRESTKVHQNLERDGFIVSISFAVLVFVLIHLGIVGTARWMSFCFLSLLLVPIGFRGREFPAAFRKKEFWIGTRAGRKLCYGLLILFSGLLGMERHVVLRSSPNLQIDLGGEVRALSFVGSSEIGPIFFDILSSNYYVRFDGEFNRVLRKP